MTWVRIDDRMPHHAKLRDAGEAAGWLWICGLCWCNAQVNDGHIRAADLACLYPGRWSARELAALAQRLVDLELWHVEPGGFLVHGYDTEQREAMRDRVEARKEKDRKRKGTAEASTRNPSGTPPEAERLPPSPGPGPGPGPGSRIPDQNSPRECVPDQVARGRPDPRDTLASAWRVGFVRRFERIAGGTHGGPAGAHMAALIDAALAQRDPATFIDRALDGFFSTPRMATMRPPFAPRWLAEDPVGYAATATTPSGATSARNSELVSEIPRAEVP